MFERPPGSNVRRQNNHLSTPMTRHKQRGTLTLRAPFHAKVEYMKSSFSILLLTATLVGCASAPVLPLSRPSPEIAGEVLVYREPAFAAGAVGLAVGRAGSAFAVLGNSEKVRALVPAGENEIFVRARSAEPTKLRVNVKPGTTVCLRTSSSPGTYAKVLVPITLMVTGYHFYLDEVPCPITSDLAKYRDVLVTYE